MDAENKESEKDKFAISKWRNWSDGGQLYRNVLDKKRWSTLEDSTKNWFKTDLSEWTTNNLSALAQHIDDITQKALEWHRYKCKYCNDMVLTGMKSKWHAKKCKQCPTTDQSPYIRQYKNDASETNRRPSDTACAYLIYFKTLQEHDRNLRGVGRKNIDGLAARKKQQNEKIKEKLKKDSADKKKQRRTNNNKKRHSIRQRNKQLIKKKRTGTVAQTRWVEECIKNIWRKKVKQLNKYESTQDLFKYICEEQHLKLHEDLRFCRKFDINLVYKELDILHACNEWMHKWELLKDMTKQVEQIITDWCLKHYAPLSNLTFPKPITQCTLIYNWNPHKGDKDPDEVQPPKELAKFYIRNYKAASPCSWLYNSPKIYSNEKEWYVKLEKIFETGYSNLMIEAYSICDGLKNDDDDENKESVHSDYMIFDGYGDKGLKKCLRYLDAFFSKCIITYECTAKDTVNICRIKCDTAKFVQEHTTFDKTNNEITVEFEISADLYSSIYEKKKWSRSKISDTVKAHFVRSGNKYNCKFSFYLDGCQKVNEIGCVEDEWSEVLKDYARRVEYQKTLIDDNETEEESEHENDDIFD
eukprot:235118_1